MSELKAAQEIVRLAARSGGPSFGGNIRHQMTNPNDYESGLEYAQKIGWVVVVGIGHFVVTDAGRDAAA